MESVHPPRDMHRWIGRGLGDRFVQIAKQRVPYGLQLWMFQVNEPARRVYERHGFVAEQFTDGAGNEVKDARLKRYQVAAVDQPDQPRSRRWHVCCDAHATQIQIS